MADEDPRYTAFVRRQPCCAQPCIQPSGPPHHATNGGLVAPGESPRGKQLGGRRGRGQTAHDRFQMSLCVKHHRQFHDKKGFFAGWTEEERRAWQDKMVREMLNKYAMQEPEPAGPSSRIKPRKRVGAAWTVAGVRDWLRKEAPTRQAAVADAYTELANLLEEDVR